MDPAEQYAYQQYLESERQRERESRSLKPATTSACRPFADIDKEYADRAWRVAERETQERIRSEYRWQDRYDKAVLTAYIALGIGFAVGIGFGWLVFSK